MHYIAESNGITKVTSRASGSESGAATASSSIITATLKLLLELTAQAQGDVEQASDLMLLLVNESNLLGVMYEVIELQRDKQTLHLLMLLNVTVHT